MEHRNNTISVLLKIVLGVEALIAPIIAENSSTKKRGGGGGGAGRGRGGTARQAWAIYF